MSFDLMSYFHNAWSWAGGGESKGGVKGEGHASVGADELKGTSHANDLLGGMVGGFGTPMDWKGAGFGGVAGGQVTGKGGGFVGGHLGAGIGAGYSSWEGDDDKGGGHLSGVSGAVGGVAPVGITAGGKNTQASASTNVYDAVGGSAYNFKNGTDHGVGAKANYVPVGLMDTNLGLNTKYGSANVHADDAYFGKLSGAAKFGENAGTYYGDVSGSQKLGIDGVNANLKTGLGTYTGSAGSVNYGPEVSGGGSYNTKTGVAEVHGGYSDGVRAKDVNLGFSSPDGNVTQSAGFGSATYGNSGDGSAKWDPTTGTFSAAGHGRGGGVVVNDIHADGAIKGVGSYHGSLGEFSNDLKVDDVTAEIDRNHAKIGGSLDGDGIRLNNGQFGGTLGTGPNALNAGAKFDSIGSGNSITKAYVDADWKKGSLGVGFDDLSYGGWSGKNLSADVSGPFGAKMHAGVGSFNEGLNASGFNATLGKDGLDANLKHADYNTLNIKDANYSASLGKYGSVDAHLGEFGTNRTVVDGAHVDASWDKGLNAHVDKASYDSVYLKDVGVDQKLGNVYQSHLGLGEGSYNHFDGKNISAGLDKNGLHASLEDGRYDYLAGKDISLKQSIGGGMLGTDIGAKSASFGGGTVGKLDYNTTLEKTHLDIQDLKAHGWTSEDIHAKMNVGALGAGADAKTLNILDAHVGSAKADTSKFGTTGSASVKDANLDVLNIQGGHAGLSWGGKEALGATGDLKSGFGLGSAKADWDLLGTGKAGGTFKDASVGSQLSNAHVNLFGTDLKVPDMGYKVNASGGANVDLTRGAANANIGLGGSSVNFGGRQITVPEFVQAQAGVDASRGAANVQLGGANGVGGHMSIADGQLDVNAFGHHVDVAGGLRDGAAAVSNTANRVWNALPSLPHLW